MCMYIYIHIINIINIYYINILIVIYIYIYIYIYIHNLSHENDLTRSRITTQFYFSITLYIFSKLLNLRSCSQNNATLYYENYITIYGFTNYFKKIK